MIIIDRGTNEFFGDEDDVRMGYNGYFFEWDDDDEIEVEVELEDDE